jgi:large subunit ribosomal protein L4
MQTSVYNLKGESAGTIELPETVFGVRWNGTLVKQAVEAQVANARQSIAHTKGRGEVRGGGKKPWRQKGTGRARHGSIRSPIWVGGGVTHGPTNEKIFEKKINKEMRRKAILVSLSRKLKDKEVLVVDALALEQSKTKTAVQVLGSLAKITGFERLGKPGGRAMFLLASRNENVIRATRNLPMVSAEEARNLNIVDMLKAKYLVLDKSSVEVIEKTLTK